MMSYKKPDDVRVITFYLDRPDDLLTKMITARGHRTETTSKKGFDVILFTGAIGDRKGQHVAPYLYGETKLDSTKVSFNRDFHSNSILRSKDFMFPKVGIGRGANFLTVASGFSLWQHVDNHYSTGHYIHTTDKDNKKSLMVSSTHDQVPNFKDSNDVFVYAYAKEAKNRQNAWTHEVKGENEHWEDPEVWYHWNTNSLCFAFHPEFGPVSGRFYFWECVEEMFGKKGNT